MDSTQTQNSVPVHVFVRHTSNEHGKFRPDWFSAEKCFENLLSVFDKVTVVFDGDSTYHFVSKFPSVDIVHTEGGADSKSFTKLLDHVLSRDDIKDDDIVYFVEDDYIHRPDSVNIIRDIFQSSNADYVSLYDHPDKYMPEYFQRFAQGFITHVVCTDKCHWKTTPSTTNTYAMKFSTLKRDREVHYKYCDFDKVGKVTQDHAKFCELWNSGKSLVTPIPGYSTHVENGMLSPNIDWVKVLESTEKNNVQ